MIRLILLMAVLTSLCGCAGHRDDWGALATGVGKVEGTR